MKEKTTTRGPRLKEKERGREREKSHRSKEEGKRVTLD